MWESLPNVYFVKPAFVSSVGVIKFVPVTAVALMLHQNTGDISINGLLQHDMLSLEFDMLRNTPRTRWL